MSAKENIKMKIAITSKGNRLDSEIDPRFGRAQYIIVIDTESDEFEAIDNNENKNAFKGAGIQAAALISDAGVNVLLTGFCGPNAFKTLDTAGVQVVNDQAGQVRDAVKKFKQGNIVYAEAANIAGNW